jgi:hypothetical protein
MQKHDERHWIIGTLHLADDDLQIAKVADLPLFYEQVRRGRMPHLWPAFFAPLF